MDLSIVIPVYNSERLLAELICRIVAAMQGERRMPVYEVILVNDCSRDGSWQTIERACEQYPQLRGVNLRTNAGQHNAIMAGLRAASGPGVREDSGAYEGYTVPRWYDTLLAKLIVWGADRPTALARMLRALGEYQVVGVRTTIPALARIIAHPDFRAGRLSTALLERILPALRPSEGRFASIAVIAAVLAEYERGRRPAPAAAADADGAPPSRWRWSAPSGWSRP